MLARSIIDYLSVMDCYGLELSLESEAICLAGKNKCPEDHLVIKRLCTIVQHLPTPASFLDVKIDILSDLFIKLGEDTKDRSYYVDQHGKIDVNLNGNIADLFSIALGYITREDFWIEPRVNSKPRTYQSIVEPVISACYIRLRSVLTSGVTSLRGIRFKYASNIPRCQESSIEKDVRSVVSNVNAVTLSVKKAVPGLGRYDVEISSIDIAYWSALEFCRMLCNIPEYLYALPLIIPPTIVDSEIVLMQMEMWIKTRNLARSALATTIQRAYRKHLLKRKRKEALWLLNNRVQVSLEVTFSLGSRVIYFTI